MLHLPTSSLTTPARRNLLPRRDRRLARTVACACLAWVTLAGPVTTSAAALATGAVTATAVPSAGVTSNYVSTVYQHLFNRAPDDGGLATWTTALRQGVPRAAVANAITSSTEYRAGLVSDAYRSYLSRTPDSTGLTQWLAQMQAGTTIQAMEGGFVASEEYYQQAGGTDSGWVLRLYRDVLGRTPGGAEVRGWTDALRRGTSRSAVATGFLLSTEHLGTAIDAQYQALLARPVDPVGRAHWVSAIQQGTRLEAVIGGIVSSAEYYGAATRSAQTESVQAPASTSPAAAPPATKPAAPAAVATPTTQVPVPPPPTAGPPARPGAKNTGVPAGTTLKIHDGDLHVTTPGAVIDAMDIRGLVKIKAPDVTIKNSIIRGRPITGDNALIMNDHGTYRFTLQDSELVAAHPSTYISGIIGANFTVERTNIHGVIDQIHITGNDVTIRNSWLHDNLHYTVDPHHHDGSHDDNIQIQAGHNITITGNTMTGSYNAALQITQDRSTVRNLTYTHNWVDNGGCTLNIAQKTRGPMTGLTFTDNTFGKNSRHGCSVIHPPTSPITFARNLHTDGTPLKMVKR